MQAFAPRRLLYVFPLALNLRAHWAARVRAAAVNYDVHVAVPIDETIRNLDLGNIVLHDIPQRRGFPSPLAEWRYFLSIFRLIRHLRPQLLHAVTIRPVIYGGIAARLMRVPALVLSITGLGYVFIGREARARLLRPFTEFAYARALHHPNAVAIFENADDRDLFVHRNLVAPDRTRVWIGGGVDLDALRASAEPDDASPLVVLPARLLVDKGVREFVEAGRTLRASFPGIRFALVGDVDPGNPATLSKAEIEGWVREGVVESWGWREDIPDIISSAVIVCLPSYREGAPMALIEAAAMGRAVVATDVPGCRQVVVDGKTGILVPARDPRALAAALSLLLSDAALRQRMGRAARHHAEKHFSASLARDRLLELYSSLTKS
ncbi:MAG: glycosyltransferase family 4 protein [Parvibaculum sp.]|uniref:glycosyltransferase family 4 protein n=1 Tax=Parvibaculum sp. TaxID=2024848 RepID=UPI003C77016E